MWKYQAVADHVARSGGVVQSAEDFARPAGEAPHEQALLCHDQEYYFAFLEDRLEPGMLRRTGFAQRPDHELLVSAWRLGLAGAILAARLALEMGVAGNLWGGTHHAHRAWGSGYNIFNDLAVAASVLLEEGVVRRVCIVDLDVHQGDGTAEIFRDDPRVFTFSMHCGDNFPFGFKGMSYLGQDRSDLDVALPAGAGDDAFIASLREHLPRALEHAPDLVLYNAGVDVHREDELGRLEVSDEGLARRDHLVFRECFQRRGVPVAFALGGGYERKDRDHSVLARRHAVTCRAAAAAWREGLLSR